MALKKNVNKFLFFATLLVALTLLSFNINKPFIGHHDWNGAFWGSVTRNYLNVFHRFTGMPIDPNALNQSDKKFLYFSHYTPFLPLLFTISTLFFGLHEASMRIVTVFFSVLLLVAIYRIANKLYSRDVGLLAVVLATFTPMFLYFGKLPDHEPIVTSLIAWSIVFWLQSEERQKVSRAFLIMSLVALAESWAAFFLIPFLMIHAMLKNSFGRRSLIALPLLGSLVVISHIILIIHFDGIEAITNFLHAGIVRLDLDQQATTVGQFTLGQFFLTEARYSVIYFTRVLMGLTMIWIITFFLSMKTQKRKDPSLTMVVLLFLPALSFLITFRNLSYIHDYKLYLVLPFISIASASALISLLEYVHRSIKRRLITVIVLMVTIVLVASERVVFLKTLLATSFNTPGYSLGTLIRNKTLPVEKSLVVSEEFESYFGVFVQFYANRSIDYEDATSDQFLTHQDDYGKYRYIIFVNNRTRDSSLPELLVKKGFQKEQINEFSFYEQKN